MEKYRVQWSYYNKKELDESIKGDHVLIIEDIVDSGNTLSKLIPMLKQREPKSLKSVYAFR